MGPIVGVQEFISMIRRRGPMIAVLLMGGLYLAINHAMSLPRTYEAVTVIQIQPTILTGSPGAETSGDTAARLRLIEQRLMARGNVVSMIERYDLFEDSPSLSENEQIAAFRQSARVEFIPAVGGGPGQERELSAMLISVRAGQAADAANLANDMADQILTSDQETRTRRLNDLTETLMREDERIVAQIAEVQSRSEAFRAQNADSLPENLDYMVAELTRLEAQRVELARSLQALDRELLALEVGDEDAVRGPSVVQQLRGLEVDLALARRTLPEGHPEVLRLENEIESVREGQVQEMTPGVARQVALIREQSTALQQEREAIEQRLPQIEAMIAAIPLTSARLDEFTRQIASLEIGRAAIAERLSRAQLDQRLSASEHGEHMVVLERATRPEYPLSSGRGRVAIMGLFGSTAFALIAAFLLELRRPVLRTSAQVRKALGVVPIAVAAFRPRPRQRWLAGLRDMTSAGIVALGIVAISLLIGGGGES